MFTIKLLFPVKPDDDIQICLKWYADSETLFLTCTISPLQFNVYIVNPKGAVTASCTAKGGICTPGMTVNVISEKFKEFVYREKINDNVNGLWKCEHGKNRQFAVTNVTITILNEQGNRYKHFYWYFC